LSANEDSFDTWVCGCSPDPYINCQLENLIWATSAAKSRGPVFKIPETDDKINKTQFSKHSRHVQHAMCGNVTDFPWPFGLKQTASL
jgi:hypothetical protein